MVRPAVAPLVIRRKLDAAAANDEVGMAGRGIFPLSVPAAANLRVRFGDTSAEPFQLGAIGAICWCSSEFKKLYLTWDAVAGGELELLVLDGDVQVSPRDSNTGSPVVLASGSAQGQAYNTWFPVCDRVALPASARGNLVHVSVTRPPKTGDNGVGGFEVIASTHDSASGTKAQNIVRNHSNLVAGSRDDGAYSTAVSNASAGTAPAATYVGSVSFITHERWLSVDARHLSSGYTQDVRWRVTCVPV